MSAIEKWRAGVCVSVVVKETADEVERALVTLTEAEQIPIVDQLEQVAVKWKNAKGKWEDARARFTCVLENKGRRNGIGKLRAEFKGVDRELRDSDWELGEMLSAVYRQARWT